MGVREKMPRARPASRTRAPEPKVAPARKRLPTQSKSKAATTPRRPAPAPAKPRIVVVGGSAGGLDSLRTLLRDLPASFALPVVVVLHLDPKSPSNAAALLAGHTLLKVSQAVAGERLSGGHVYLAHPDRHLEVRQGRIHLSRAARVNYSRPSVDRLFRSAAEAYGSAALGIVLSGTGYDGREGVQAIHAAGGACIAEDPTSAAHGGMPEAAIASGVVEAVLPADRMGLHLLQRAMTVRVPVTPAAWKRAATLLCRRFGIDFEGYRPETLRRRMEVRIAATGMPSAAAYVASLPGDDAELERLRSALLVKVSSFIRDPKLWHTLESRVLAPLARRPGKREVRIWSAGCATGEEAYTLAMLTLVAAPAGLALRVFATDIDEPSLVRARAGWYPGASLLGLPRPLLRRFLKADGDGRRVVPQVRRHVIFGRHDLVRDAPLSSMDVVACRNVLIYFQPAERQAALDRLTAALRPGGVLFLGKAEGVPLPGPGFTRLVPGMPIFRKDHGARPAVPRLHGLRKVPAPRRRRTPARPVTPPQALLAVDEQLRVTLWGPTAEAAFLVPSAEALGKALPSLIRGASPELASTLRHALAGRKRRRLPALGLPGPGSQVLSAEAVPLPEGHGLLVLGRVEVPALRGQSASVATLPAERAQFSIDAQQALNEELQSRNEELETVNEELQSLNDEIQVQGDESRRASLFLAAMLDAGPDIVIGCDRRGLVTYWGAPAVRQFGLSSEQALGKDVLRIVPRLDVPSLQRLVRKGEAWRKGRKSRAVGIAGGLRVTVVPALDGDGRMHGTLLRILAQVPGKKR